MIKKKRCSWIWAYHNTTSMVAAWDSMSKSSIYWACLRSDTSLVPEEWLSNECPWSKYKMTGIPRESISQTRLFSLSEPTFSRISFAACISFDYFSWQLPPACCQWEVLAAVHSLPQWLNSPLDSNNQALLWYRLSTRLTSSSISGRQKITMLVCLSHIKLTD